MSDIDKYFKNLTDREHAIFEGAVSMGALYHQFVGTPVSIESSQSLKDAIAESIMLQPAVVDVKVDFDMDLMKKAIGDMQYTSLDGNMLIIEITTQINDTKIVTRISYNEELQYPLMYVKD